MSHFCYRRACRTGPLFPQALGWSHKQYLYRYFKEHKHNGFSQISYSRRSHIKTTWVREQQQLVSHHQQREFVEMQQENTKWRGAVWYFIVFPFGFVLIGMRFTVLPSRTFCIGVHYTCFGSCWTILRQYVKPC